MKHLENDKTDSLYAFKEGTSKSFRAVKISTYLFLLRKYWFFFLAFSILSLIYMISMPFYASLSALVFWLFLKIFKPYKSRKRLRLGSKIIFIVSFILSLFSFYMLMSSTDYRMVLSLSQGIFYGMFLSYISYFFVGLFHKYENIYAIDITHPDEWKTAERYIWEDKII